MPTSKYVGMVGGKSLEQSHNKQDKFGSEFQPGGAAILVLNKATRPGGAIMGPGQWCWIGLWGKDNHFIRIMSLYHPCKANSYLTTYQQQTRWLSSI